MNKLEQEFDIAANADSLKKFGDYSPSSAKKVWWKCSKDPRHRWEARIFSRTNQGAGCPFCAGKKVLPDSSLGHNYPKLLSEWSYGKNFIDPFEIPPRSGKKVWWKCSQGHEWCASITHRTSGGRNNTGTGCPYCSNQKTCEANSILVTHPQLINEWDFIKNIGINPSDVVAGSHKVVWWKCPVADDHEWKASLSQRTTKNTGCPCCPGTKQRKIVKSNCLETTHPSVAKEWHPTKNILTPRDVTYASNKKAWFLCQKDTSHEWECRIDSRGRGDQCPFCASSKGEKIIKDWLDKKCINYKQEYKLSDCKSKRQLPFDFGIFNENKELLGLIEYQGRQHYQPIEYFGGLKSLLMVQKNDKIKKTYCDDNQIPLLVISFTDFEFIDNKLLYFINNLPT